MDIDEQIGVLTDQIDAAKITSNKILDYFITKNDYNNAIQLELIYDTLNICEHTLQYFFYDKKQTKKEDD
jgi:hypothetical protein